MPALADVNLLLALATDRHEHHAPAAAWFDEMGGGDVVICRVAQMGLLRLLNNPAVLREEAMDSKKCWALWRSLIRDERIVFTTTEPVGLDDAFAAFTVARAFIPKLWTDAYLAAYARCAGLEMTTFDNGFKGFSGLACRILSPVSRSR